jgi:hypothetical protein
MKIVYILFLVTLLFGDNFIKQQGYIVDKQHNLIWQDTKENIVILKNQSDAVQYCQDLVFAGYDDWELPSREQYRYILDKTRDDELMINRKFKYILKEHYWTRDKTWRNFNRWGYFVYFKSGTFYYNNKSYLKYVRCVRQK